jgi:hypothetical protein
MGRPAVTALTVGCTPVRDTAAPASPSATGTASATGTPPVTATGPATSPPHHVAPGSANTTAPPGPLPCPEHSDTTRRVTGMVVDTAGRPLTGIVVYGAGCLREDGARSDAHGRFSAACAEDAKPFTRFLMAAPWVLYFGHEHTSVASWATDAGVGYASIGSATNPVRCGRSYRLVLRPAARVVAHLPARYGDRLYLTARGWPWPIEGLVDARHDVWFDGLAPGRYHVGPDPHEDDHGQDVTVAAGGTARVTIR